MTRHNATPDALLRFWRESGAMAAQGAGLAADAARPIERSYAWDQSDAPTAIVERLWGAAAFAYHRQRAGGRGALRRAGGAVRL
jgi:hypothetical protein